MANRGSYVFAGAALILLSACVRRPEGVLSDAEMVQVVTDLELAEAYVHTQALRGEGERSALVDHVLATHGLSREEFDSTMSWYGRNVDAYYDLCESVEKELSRRKGRMTGGMTVESSDLWPYSRQTLIACNSPSESFGFTVPTVDVRPGQRVELRFRLRDRVDGTAMLGVEYDNGLKSFMPRSLSGVRRVKMVLQTDTGMTVRRIFGNMLLNDASRTPLWIDSISLSVLPFDSLEYYNIHGQRKFSDPKERRRPPEEEPDTLTVVTD